MIAKLTGLVDTRAKDHAIVDVNGVAIWCVALRARSM
jgi:Holliday junction resolvasome RuvABC DNA-binding subunit